MNVNTNAIHQNDLWYRSFDYAVKGLAIISIAMMNNVFDYWAQPLGILLIVIGLRRLRAENVWFRTCFFVTILEAVCIYIRVVLYATIYGNVIFTASFTKVWSVFLLLVTSFLYLCLWIGFRAVQNKVRLKKSGYELLVMMASNIIITILALCNKRMFLIPFMLLYIYMLTKIENNSNDICNAGYMVQEESSKVSKSVVIIILVFLFTIGISGGYLFGAKYPMNWKDTQEETNQETETMKEHLAELGFPEELLADLSDSDLESLKTAVQVVVRQEHRDKIRELHTDAVAAKISAEPEQWRIFHYFQWDNDTKFYGTDCIQLRTAYGQDQGWNKAGEVTGQLLYNKGNQVYTSSFYYIGEAADNNDKTQYGHEDMYAAFSMPKQGEACRGYLTYAITEEREGNGIDSWMDYTHQTRTCDYPVTTAINTLMPGNSGRDCFTSIQDQLLFHPDELE